MLPVDESIADIGAIKHLRYLDLIDDAVSFLACVLHRLTMAGHVKRIAMFASNDMLLRPVIVGLKRHLLEMNLFSLRFC